LLLQDRGRFRVDERGCDDLEKGIPTPLIHLLVDAPSTRTCKTIEGALMKGMEMLLENKNAVVYGAGGAVGGALARAFAREGAKVFLAGRTIARLDALAKEYTVQEYARVFGPRFGRGGRR